jgi:hypothetical protein
MLHCRTLDLTSVRAALTAALEAQDFRVCPWMQDQWSPPCALVGAFTVEFADSSYDSLATATVSVRLVVPAQALRPAQQDLDVMVCTYVAALAASPTLGEACLRVLPVRAVPVATAKGSADLPSYDCETVIIL